MTSITSSPSMGFVAITYAVSWRDSEGSTGSGRLDLGDQGFRLDGSDTLEIDYDEVLDISIGRATRDRLGARPSLLVTCTNGRLIWIAPVAQRAALLELHDRLGVLALGLPT
jgi:hypothetical protein